MVALYSLTFRSTIMMGPFFFVYSVPFCQPARCLHNFLAMAMERFFSIIITIILVYRNFDVCVFVCWEEDMGTVGASWSLATFNLYK